MDACAWRLDPLTSTTEELCGCLGRGSTGPSSRRAGRGPGHKTREAAPAGEPGASHKGRLGGRLRQQWQSRRAVGDGKLCRAGQELRRNVRAVHEQHSQLFRALAQFSSSGNAVSDSSAAPARAYPPPAPLTPNGKTTNQRQPTGSQAAAAQSSGQERGRPGRTKSRRCAWPAIARRRPSERAAVVHMASTSWGSNSEPRRSTRSAAVALWRNARNQSPRGKA